MKLVNENIEDVLKPKSEEDLEVAFYNRLWDFERMDPKEIVDSIAEEFGVGTLDVAIHILNNIEHTELHDSIKLVYNDYLRENRKIDMGRLGLPKGKLTFK
ncbi:MAG: hypothetical protein GYA51_06880 [Candidatus Methanofastidiosa archaeon]|jgi:hypothetical protein|nr:hypothetical protein [Candidatus Methanofastidiosa archaeon]